MDIRLGRIRETLLRAVPGEEKEAERALELGFKQFRNARVIPESDPLCCMQASVTLWVALNEKAAECGVSQEGIGRMRALIRQVRSRLPASMCSACSRENDRMRVDGGVTAMSVRES